MMRDTRNEELGIKGKQNEGERVRGNTEGAKKEGIGVRGTYEEK